MLRWHQQIYMPEYPSTGFIQHKVAQPLILGNERSLLPDGISRRRCYASNDDVAHLSFSVNADDMY